MEELPLRTPKKRSSKRGRTSYTGEYLIGLEHRLQALVEETPVLADVAHADSEKLKETAMKESGRAVLITVQRECSEPVEIIIPKNASVKELKRKIEKVLNRHGAAERRVNWFMNIYDPSCVNRKYIWKKHVLAVGPQKLLYDTVSIAEFGVQENSVVKFLTKSPTKRK